MSILSISRCTLRRRRLCNIVSVINIGELVRKPPVNRSYPHLSKEYCTVPPEKGSYYCYTGDLLRKVYALVQREKLVAGLLPGTKVVEFKHPHQLKEILDLSIGEKPLEGDHLVDRILHDVVKYSVKTTHTNFHNQLYGGLDEVALAGAWLTEALHTQQHTFEVAPVFTLMEQRVIQDVGKLFGLSEPDGIFAPGGSIANMYGLILARHKKFPAMKENGITGEKPLAAFTSDMSHYWVKKAAMWAGLGLNSVIVVPTDERGKMIVPALRSAISQARQDGMEPFFVNATCGTTVLGAFDPLVEINEVCQEEGVWMHTDACLGGVAAFSSEYKHLLRGIERADSVAFNAHKILGAPLQCSLVFVSHKDLLSECNSLGASYLFQQDKFYDVSYDTGDKSLQCGRKADAFKLWLCLKVHGLKHFENLVNNAFSSAKYLEEKLRHREGFRLVMDSHECTNVCFWFIPPSLRNLAEDKTWWSKVHKVAPVIKKRMVLEGSLMIGYQPLEKKNLVNFFRMVNSCTPPSTPESMDFIVEEIDRLGEDL